MSLFNMSKCYKTLTSRNLCTDNKRSAKFLHYSVKRINVGEGAASPMLETRNVKIPQVGLVLTSVCLSEDSNQIESNE